MVLLQVVIGLSLGLGLLFYCKDPTDSTQQSQNQQDQVENNELQEGKEKINQETQPSTKIQKYLEILEKGTSSDIQAIVKKIDDLEERRELIKLIKQKLSTKPLNKEQQQINDYKRLINMNVEDQLLETTDTLVKKMLTVIAEVLIVLVCGIVIGHYIGVIDVHKLI